MPTRFVNDISMFYVEEGRGEPLCLLHGLGGSSAMWQPVQVALARTHRVVAADHRGHGASSKPRGSYSIKLFVDDWLALMDALGVERAHLLGLSMGGAIALELAVGRPDRVRSLILEDTWAFPHPAFVSHMEARLRALDEGGLAAYADVAIPVIFSEPFARAHPEAVRGFGERLAELDPAALRAAVQACIAHDVGGRLTALDRPTLILVGGEDRLTPPLHASYLHQGIRGSHYVAIAGAGHIPHLEQPGTFLEAVQAFLARV